MHLKKGEGTASSPSRKSRLDESFMNRPEAISRYRPRRHDHFPNGLRVVSVGMLLLTAHCPPTGYASTRLDRTFEKKKYLIALCSVNIACFRYNTKNNLKNNWMQMLDMSII